MPPHTDDLRSSVQNAEELVEEMASLEKLQASKEKATARIRDAKAEKKVITDAERLRKQQQQG